MNTNNIAVPPPANAFASFDRGRSNSAVMMTGRLRAASDWQRQGVISKEEKTAIKQMILKSDPTFRSEFDQARKTGDLTAIKKVLMSNAALQDTMLTDMTEMTLGDVDDFSSFLDELQESSGSNNNGNSSIKINSNNNNPGIGAGNVAIPPPPPALGGPGQMHTQHRQSVGFGSEFSQNPSLKGLVDPAQLVADGYTRKRQASKSMPAQGMHKLVATTPNNTELGPNNPLNKGSAFPPSSSMHSQQRSSHPARVKVESTMFMAPQQQQVKPPPMMGGMPGSNGSAGPSPQLGQQQQSFLKMGTTGMNGMIPPNISEAERIGLAKSRKNERERKRRLAVTQGFDELYKLLKKLEEERQAAGEENANMSLIATSKLDKASILRNAIEKIQELEQKIVFLKSDNTRLSDAITRNGGGGF